MRILAFLAALLLAVPAGAASFTARVVTAKGKPVQDAVVMLYPVGHPVPTPRPAGVYEVVQQSMQFWPYVLVVPVGADVSFPNRDPFRHHVYSFSPAKRFDLKLFAKAQSRVVRFDRAGFVPLGCNIHDRMSAFIAVVDTAWSAKTDAAGLARFEGLPGGAVRARIWHPWQRAPGNQIELRIAVTPGGEQRIPITLRPPPPAGEAAY